MGSGDVGVGDVGVGDVGSGFKPKNGCDERAAVSKDMKAQTHTHIAHSTEHTAQSTQTHPHTRGDKESAERREEGLGFRGRGRNGTP